MGSHGLLVVVPCALRSSLAFCAAACEIALCGRRTAAAIIVATTAAPAVVITALQASVLFCIVSDEKRTHFSAERDVPCAANFRLFSEPRTEEFRWADVSSSPYYNSGFPGGVLGAFARVSEASLERFRRDACL